MAIIEITTALIAGIAAYCVFFALIHAITQTIAVLIRGVPKEVSPPQALPPSKISYGLAAAYADAWMRWMSCNGTDALSTHEGYGIICRTMASSFARANDDAPIREWKRMWRSLSGCGMDDEIREMKGTLS